MKFFRLVKYFVNAETPATAPLRPIEELTAKHVNVPSHRVTIDKDCSGHWTINGDDTNIESPKSATSRNVILSDNCESLLNILSFAVLGLNEQRLTKRLYSY